ncbi:MAG: ABC transporter permease [Phycisphaerae bacterium]|nr:ABC transporter permease [Phycisphaerae bacterium]
MSLWRLVTRSLVFFWRTHLGVFLAAAVATMILTGALLVGDSVRYSLRRLVGMRLGDTELALVSPNRFFRAALGEELAKRLDARVAPVLQLRGLMTDGEAATGAPRIQVLGVDARFFAMAGQSETAADIAEDAVVLNEPLAAKLKVEVGDDVVLRIAKPGLMPRDVPLTPDSDLSVGFRLRVAAIAGEGQFGRFSLQANQMSPYNAFVPLGWLGAKTDQAGRANLLLAASAGRRALDIAQAGEALAGCVRLDDLGLEVRTLAEEGLIEVISRKIFIDDVLAKAVTGAGKSPVGVFTYFVNELRLGDKATPYSFVTGMGAEGDAGLMPADMADDETIINEWLAEDLGASVGETIVMKYYVAGAGGRLTEESAAFRVRAIVPIAGAAADAQLMPAFPGLADADDCRDWKPGIAIDLDKIREKDETWWDMYRGTPKAFVTLAAGQKMWGNRFGGLTAVRFSMDAQSAKDIASHIVKSVEPASAGLFFEAVRAAAQRATAQATDFGHLFLGLSMFLIASAVILLGLVFVFGVEKRSDQSGLLLSVGYTPQLIRRLFVIEGALIAGAGAIVGVIGALVYTGIMIGALSTIWKGAIGGSVVYFHAGPVALLMGLSAGVAVSAGAIWLTLRKQLHRPAREFLEGNLQEQFLSAGPRSRGRAALIVAGVCAALAVLLLFVFGRGSGTAVSGAFFAAGALLLTAGLCGVFFLLAWLGRAGGAMHSVGQLALRNTTRRSGRSLAVAALLASGCFLVISIGAFREEPLTEAHERDSGTGGFAFIGETSVPVLGDLNSPDGRKAVGLNEAAVRDLEVVQFRVRDGEDASCLNLNRVQRPRLLGVKPEALQSRGAFAFAGTTKGTKAEEGWALLNIDIGEDVVPAVGDAEMIKWMFGKGIGDEIEYTDERGRRFKLRLVGGLQNSVLQGSLVIAADAFTRRFPSEDGYRLFLIEAEKDRAPVVESAFSKALADFGMDMNPTVQRMAELNAVKNTYLSIFQVLGGLGLLLGSVGLALVVLLNVLERRGELGMMRALGFAEQRIKQIILYEHVLLVGVGLCAGVAAALIAMAPAIASPGAGLPYMTLSAIIGAIAASAAVWIYIAAGMALRGSLLDAIRNE